MTVEVAMPQMGADMTEGTVVKWLKQVGERVTRGESIAEIETDKANVELEAFDSGVLLKILAQEGAVVPVGHAIAILGEPGEEAGEPAAPEQQKSPASPPAPTPTQRADGANAQEMPPPAMSTGTSVASAQAAASPGDERIRISPVARRIAADFNVDTRALQGSGPDGRILRRDIEAAIAKLPTAPAVAAAMTQTGPAAAPGGPPEPLSRIRQTIARRMLQSKQQQPHYYLTIDVDMTAAEEARRAINATVDETRRVTINDLVIKASALALARHPRFTAQFTDAGLVYPEQLDINIGVAIDEGLIAPAVLDCGNKTLGRIAQDARGVISRAREGKLTSDDYISGCFTITNLGNFGVDTLIGVINPPQAAILGVGSAMPRPVVREGAIVVRQVMTLALSADHRVSNGAEGALFIKEIQHILENPVSLAL